MGKVFIFSSPTLGKKYGKKGYVRKFEIVELFEILHVLESYYTTNVEATKAEMGQGFFVVVLGPYPSIQAYSSFCAQD